MGNKASTITKKVLRKNKNVQDSSEKDVNDHDRSNNTEVTNGTVRSDPAEKSANTAASASAATPSAATTQNSAVDKSEEFGLRHIDFVNVHRKDYTGRIELLQGQVEKLAKTDETDLLIVYLSERGQYKGNRDSALAALNRGGISLLQLEKETKPQPSYRRHYHCWLSRPIPKPRPPGFEYKRLLIYEDPGDELTRDDNIVLDIMKCMTTVIGGDIQISSVMLPLSGALLSPQLRKHFVQAAVTVTYCWMMMGLPLRIVRILLPETDISKDIEVFKKTKEKLLVSNTAPAQASNFDVFMSYAMAEKEAAEQMMNYLRKKNSAIRIFNAEPRDVKVRDRGVVNEQVMEAITQSRVFLALLSDDYFHSVECTEAFSLAYCRDFDSQGNFIIPLFWRSCDLTPLARRLVATEGVDCREASFEASFVLLDEILSAICQPEREVPTELPQDSIDVGKPPEMRLADALLMKREGMEQHNEIFDTTEQEENISQMFFDRQWRESWSIEFKSIVFGPRIGAGGFGEVYKAKYNNEMVAVKTLQKIEDDDPQAVIAEFMVEMKLMSKLRHPNIVSFLGASIVPPNLAIMLEFMPGGSLYRAIHRRRRNHMGAFPLLKTTWIAYGIAKGMEYLHAQYPVIIHRDLKSPNILLGSNVHEVKVTDFGLSRLRVATYVKTGPGGTPEWMAPELLRQDKFDESSDVFSFGVILWELIMCEKPWKDDHPMQIVFKVGSRGEKLSIPSTVQVLPELREMVTACFQDKPERRPQFPELVRSLEYLCRRVEANNSNA
mmetsp:Transcript_5336/g.15943  ORF Transcript_5336/g.15943 Transcript_5336/m.15943 type:complete len:779 (-) Transcript_5336:1775-4111(-)